MKSDLATHITKCVWNIHKPKDLISPEKIQAGFSQAGIAIDKTHGNLFWDMWRIALDKYKERFGIDEYAGVTTKMALVILESVVINFLEKEGDQL